jgi:hypothetical protein
MRKRGDGKELFVIGRDFDVAVLVPAALPLIEKEGPGSSASPGCATL